MDLMNERYGSGDRLRGSASQRRSTQVATALLLLRRRTTEMKKELEDVRIYSGVTRRRGMRKGRIEESGDDDGED